MTPLHLHPSLCTLGVLGIFIVFAAALVWYEFALGRERAKAARALESGWQSFGVASTLANELVDNKVDWDWPLYGQRRQTGFGGVGAEAMTRGLWRTSKISVTLRTDAT